MEENNKYYTPSIEEFHVGFECELRNFDNGEWRSYVFSLNQVCFDKDGNTKEHAVVFWIKHGEVRVKYLDAADIEECGWVLKSEGNIIVFKRNEPIDPNESEEFLEYWHLTLHNDGTVIVHNNGFYDSEIIIFYGKIKNKSELKRLMKQLGIYEQHNK